MENRSSFFLVGVFVLVSMIGLIGLASWLAKRNIDKSYDLYEVAFSGSVNGLQQGSTVYYRGVPVGHVRDIRIDPENITKVLALIEVESETPVKSDTTAELTMQGVTGLASIELRGGSNESANLEPGPDGKPPRMNAAPSAIEKFVESTPQLLARASDLAERLGSLASDDNLKVISAIFRNAEKTMANLSENSGKFDKVIDNTITATEDLSEAAESARQLMPQFAALATTLNAQTESIGTDASGALAEFNEAAKAMKNLAWRLDRTVEGIQRPLDDFGQSGLYDFSEMVREMRQLVASLTRITKEFERDPAGFLIGGSQRGFVPK
ncbi:MAG: MCE family protein [Geminicoccaceae bacterium]|nr:MCE family protein [Geminicoccaceae bacterium]MCB9942536.1 MCE family protein [Geminicoccaceae bacterium]